MSATERARDVARTIRYVGEVKLRASWSREKIVAFQREKLIEILNFAREKSPYFSRVLPRSNELSEFPILDKPGVVRHFDEIVTDRSVTFAEAEKFALDEARARGIGFFHERYSVLLTGGTSGLRAIAIADRSIAALEAAIAIARLDVPMPRRFWRPHVVTLGSADTRHGSGFAARFMPPLMSEQTPVSADTPIDQLVKLLNEKDPDLLSAYPSALVRLVPQCRSGALRIRPAAIVCGGEVLSPAVRSLIGDAFRSFVSSIYGTTECGPIALECRRGRLHVMEDFCVLEVADENGRPVKDGDFGDIVLVTHLFNRVFPYIRYRFDDRVRMGVGPCSCGSAYKWIDSIEGRSGTATRFEVPAKGQGTTPVIGWKLHLYLLGLPGVLGAQVILEAPAKLRIDYLPQSSAPADLVQALRTRAAGYIDNLGGDAAQVEISVRQVSELATIPGSAKTFAYRDLSRRS